MKREVDPEQRPVDAPGRGGEGGAGRPSARPRGLPGTTAARSERTNSRVNDCSLGSCAKTSAGSVAACEKMISTCLTLARSSVPVASTCGVCERCLRFSTAGPAGSRRPCCPACRNGRAGSGSRASPEIARRPGPSQPRNAAVCKIPVAPRGSEPGAEMETPGAARQGQECCRGKLCHQEGVGTLPTGRECLPARASASWGCLKIRDAPVARRRTPGRCGRTSQRPDRAWL